MYVTVYLVVIAYFLLAAISPQATVIPNTWPELARLAVLCVFAAGCYWWGAMSKGLVVLLAGRTDHPTGGLRDTERDVT